MLREIGDDRKADRPDKGSQNNGAEHPPVRVVGDQATAQDDKAGIIEHRDCHKSRMEERFPYCFMAQGQEAGNERNREQNLSGQ